MKTFLYHMLTESNGIKFMYKSTIFDFIEFVEAKTGLKCPDDKELVIQEFLKVWKGKYERDDENFSK